jgi:hypothetical protein
MMRIALAGFVRMSMLMLDLFSGLGGASKAMKERGWEVITVDIIPAFNPTIISDIRDFHYAGLRPDLIWASPPCVEFSKASFPMSWACNRNHPPAPDVGLMLAAKRIIEEAKPRYWVIENVRGARPFFEPILGAPRKITGSRVLWGHFPIFDCDPAGGDKWRLPPSEDRAAKRALIPHQVSRALALAIEQT